MIFFTWLINCLTSKTACWLCEEIIQTKDAKFINGIFYCSDECYYDEKEYEKLASQGNEEEIRKLMKKVEMRVNFRKEKIPK